MAYQKIKSHDEYLEIVEQYEDYEAGTYKSMTLKEKMNFFDGVHTDNIPLFDEDGDDMATADDYYSIRDEFLNQPEQFSLNDIPAFWEMLDDNCYQPAFMDNITMIIHNIVRYYQLEGVVFLLAHLDEVPERGYAFGRFVSLGLLLKDDVTYPLMKKALGLLPADSLRIVLGILNGEDRLEVSEKDGENGKSAVFDDCGRAVDLQRKRELENIISALLAD